MVSVDSHIQPMPVPAAMLENAALNTLLHEGAEGDLSVLLSDDAHLRDLNREYLGMDAATDVLSFPAAERDPETGSAYVGDVIVSVPQAEIQSRAAGHSLEAEVQLLVVHGVLHLLGHDHGDSVSRQRMWSAQAEILAGLGLPNLQIQE